MVRGAMGGALGHFRDLFSYGTAVGLDDGQLLARYAQDRDQAAFEALVTRHGPMVLGTCRAVLKHDQDVEDAFQATFLVLARKAHSVRAGEALGGWLHRVAYRAAVQASVESRRRRLREAEAAMAVLQASPGDSDIPAIVHEELERLPDHQKLPVVLCDLEGLTYEQAAGQLRWTEPTLRHRLAKARRRLRDRLIRRGVSAGALGGLPASPISLARSPVPIALIRSTVAGAVGSASSSTAVNLANIILGSMLMTKLKLAAAGALAVLALVSGGIVAVGALSSDEPKGAGKAPDAAKAGAAARLNPKRIADPKSRAQDGPKVPIEGRIVDLEGRPVPGAKVEMIWLWSVPDNDLTRWLDQARDRGMSYAMQNRVMETPGLQPGAGRPSIPASQGSMPAGSGSMPVPKVTSLGEKSLSLQGQPQAPSYPTATAGPDGRFRLDGFGPTRVAQIRVTGPSIATSHVFVTGREQGEVRATQYGGPKAGEFIFHPRRLQIVASPVKPIAGIVRDKETGQPLAGVTLRGAVYEGNSLIPAEGVETKTDEKGSYRLAGLPKASAYRVFVEPGAGKPYPNASFRVEGASPAFDPVTFDITLKRGILVRGTVTDKVSGRPIQRGYVEVFAFRDNPHVSEFPGYSQGSPPHVNIKDGHYEILALPGRSLIGFREEGQPSHYRGFVGVKEIMGYDPKYKWFNTYPYTIHVGNYHALAELNIDPKAESATLDLQVDPGRAVTVKVIDPDGKPIPDTTASGITDLFSSNEYPQKTSEIEIFALDPSLPRRVTVAHKGRKLIGSVYLKGDEAGPLTLRLRPAGTIVGRVVDEDGKPRGGISIGSIHGTQPKQPDVDGILPGGNSASGIALGRDGKFRIEGLVPGLKYGGSVIEGSMYRGDLFQGVIVGPGEIKDLGDLKPIMPRRPD